MGVGVSPYQRLELGKRRGTEFFGRIYMNTVDHCPHCQQTFGRPRF